MPFHAHGTTSIATRTSSSSILTEHIDNLFKRIVNPSLLIRRITLTACNVMYESDITRRPQAMQLDLFTDYDKLRALRRAEAERLSRERNRQRAILNIKKKFGKNAILRGLNYAEGATQKERNMQIGGHHE